MELYDLCTRLIIERELSDSMYRWRLFPRPLPLAFRLMIKLTELNPQWAQEAHDMIAKPVSNNPENVPSQKKSRRGRKKRKNVTWLFDAAVAI